ncbi:MULTISPECIES: AAA family ATPase [unclassified Rhizobium]|uniref:AAA family ATPase n=1 Tax=unclassified Rhizobium TaxID=2613769 RepID=UPI0007EBFE5A|nr:MULTISPECIES: AAA family ATPase [unclassified Rhizobium]ANK91552.1 ATP-dependent peptidase M41 family protein [Rhizobium sp. N6212]ANK97585.1 ATP-dependent peptidase M41 family protein [Rhizobium sp. N621]
MDTAFKDNLDQYISKLQRIAIQLNGVRRGDPLRIGREGAAIAMRSARLFLSYCALVHLVRRNIELISEPFCVALIVVPAEWQLTDVNEAAKILFKDEKMRFCMHPATKSRRGWEIDPAEQLIFGKLIIFVTEGSAVHEDFELAATMRDRLRTCDVRHLRALARLRGCGDISDDEAALIAEQPSERMEAIFRIGQPARRAAHRLAEFGPQRPVAEEVKHLDISKGFGEAGDWAQELKRDLRDWRDGKLPWSEVDKGCLLYGPPGTGKTRFAAALAAECDMHLEATSISRWQSSKDGHLGDLLKAMYRSFANAKEKAPCLLFLDEFDSIGDRAKFVSSYADYSIQVVNGLLECIDGIEGREGVVVVGACNNPERIDPALVRSGRLEKHIHFPLPDAQGRAQILAFHLPSLADEPLLKEIAAKLPGKSGADLERLARDARRVARRERRSVTIDDLYGNIEPLPVLNECYQLKIAIHEAGHALVGHGLNVGTVRRVEIFDNVENFATQVDAHGVIVMRHPTLPIQTRGEMLNRIAFHLAGAAAEEVFYGDRSTTASGGSQSDFAKATEIAVEMITKWGFGKSPYYLPGSVNTSNPGELWRDHRLRAEVNEILQTEYARAKDILSDLKQTLIAFATELARHKSLQGDELEKLWPQPFVPSDTEAPKS